MQKIRKKIADLTKQINRANDLYFNQDKPEISDAKYDQLLAQLVALEEKHPELKAKDSPTQSIGASVSPSFASVKHTLPMLSLEKAHDIKKIKLFLDRCKAETNHQDCLVTPKLDGIAISLNYVKGKLTIGATRGDGEYGEDITENLFNVSGIFKEIKGEVPPKLMIRGEVVMPHEAFTKANQVQKEAGNLEFVNPRNAAAGILRQKKAKAIDNKSLMFIAYWAWLGEEQPATNSEVFAKLIDWGFTVSKPYQVLDNLADCEYYLKKIEDERANFEYDIDGVVLRLDNSAAQEKMGRTAKAPRSMIAYKFSAQEVVTTLEDVEYQLGRTGVLTPVAILKPIKVSGAVVTKATLHNCKFIEKLGIRKRDKVKLIRSGDVIPKILGLADIKRKGNEEKIKLPTKCPECNSPLQEDDVNLICTGKDCVGTKVAVFRHFVSRPVMDIDGIGDKLVTALIQNKLVDNPADIFKLTKKDIFKLERKKDKSVNNIITAINKAKNTSLDRVLMSLGINGLGKTGAEVIANSPNPMKLLTKASPEVISFLETINYKTAKYIQIFFNLDLVINNTLFTELDIPNFIPLNQIEILKQYKVKWKKNAPKVIHATIADFLNHLNYLIKAKEEDKKLISQTFIDYIKNHHSDVKEFKELTKIDYNKLNGTIKLQAKQIKNYQDIRKTILADKGNKKLFTELNRYLDIKWGEVEVKEGVFANKTVLITGSIEGHTRTSAQGLVIKNGGEVVSAISGKTDLVVVGEKAGQSKLDKIDKLKIKTITAQEFLNLTKSK